MLTSVHEAINQPFTKYHRITGLPFRNRVKHIAKHASLPLLTLYPISMTRAISGLVLIEIVFNWPGIGFTVVEAVLSRDTPVIQFVFFISAAFIIFANFAVDIAYGIIDPRISLSND
jgi:peptide/nickel transport system permease protein